MSTAYDGDTQVEVYRLFASVIKAYCNESARGEEEVLTLMLDQLQAFQTLSSAVQSSNTPERALVSVLEPFDRLGRAPRVQLEARSSGMLSHLGNLLLCEDAQVQDKAVTALMRLQEDCLENRRALTDANVPFLLCPLLQSGTQTVREAAAAALAQFVRANKHEEMSVAEQTKEALASADCIPTLRPLLQSSNDKLRMNALSVLHALSSSPSLVPKMIQAGVVTPTVAMLTQPNASDESLEKAARIICNVAITNKEVRARVHGAGGLAIAVQLLQSPKAALRSCACELINTFSADLEAQVILRDSNAVETLLRLLSTGSDAELIGRGVGSGGFGIYAANALSKMLSTRTDIGYSHRITAVQANGGQVLARLLQTCRTMLKPSGGVGSSGADVASGAIFARHIASCIDALGRDPQALGAMYLGGGRQAGGGTHALGSAVTGLLQVLQVILELSQSSATVSAASIIVAAVGSLCGASLPRAGQSASDPMLSQQHQHAVAAATMARQHVTGRQGVEYFMPLLARPMVSVGGNTGENMRLNALRVSIFHFFFFLCVVRVFFFLILYCRALFFTFFFFLLNPPRSPQHERRCSLLLPTKSHAAGAHGKYSTSRRWQTLVRLRSWHENSSLPKTRARVWTPFHSCVGPRDAQRTGSATSRRCSNALCLWHNVLPDSPWTLWPRPAPSCGTFPPTRATGIRSSSTRCLRLRNCCR
jgi:hypothetical protein